MKTIFPSKRRFDRQRSVENGKEAFFTQNTEHHPVQKKNDGGFFQNPESSGLLVGKKGDKYENEADAVADRVICHPGQGNAVQKKEISAVKPGELKDNHINRKAPEEEEPVQGKQLETIQKQEPEEELPIQGKMDEEEPVQGKQKETLQMQGPEEEEPLQGKAEEEEPLQAKANNSNPPQPHQQIKDTKGSGQKIPDNTRIEMENAFGVSFSNVTIHTDNAAMQMNESLNAQAFTTGRDIYFNKNNYSPETSKGKHLLAHELTHVVQQNKENIAHTQLSAENKAVQPSEFKTHEEMLVKGMAQLFKQMNIEDQKRGTLLEAAAQSLRTKNVSILEKTLEQLSVSGKYKEKILEFYKITVQTPMS